MQLVVLGLNHKTVPVDIREQFAISPDSARSGLIHLDEQEGIEEAVVLSTCNRTEIYAVLKDETAKERYGVIADFMKLGGETLDEKVELLIKYLRGMNDDLNIPHCIKNYGADSYPTEQGFVPEEVFLERLPEIAANAILDACTGSNPRQPSQEEMEKLLKCCYYDTDVDF